MVHTRRMSTPTPPAAPSGGLALTADLGEGYGAWTLTDDDALLDIVTSANVACGFHAGDPSTMRRVCERAVARGVSIGAQVSYPDRRGFGRRYVDVPPDELADDLLYQVGALQAFAAAAGGTVSFLRAHGALYTRAATDPEHARAIVATASASRLPILCQAATEVWRQAADAGVTTFAEAFADRAYTADGLLLPRTRPGAVITDPDDVVERVVDLAHGRPWVSVDGAPIHVRADAVVIHGDTPGAVDLARRVRRGLDEAGVALRPL